MSLKIATNYWKDLKIRDLPGEKWKKVKMYDGVYASNLGRIKSRERWVKNRWSNRFVPEIINSQCKGKDGYLRVSIRVKGKEKKVTAHRLCALAFKKNPLNKKTVHHKNHIKHCNQSWNLLWFTQSEQLLDAYRKNNRKPPRLGCTGKKSVFSKQVICLNTGRVYESATQAAQKLKMSRVHITELCSGRYKCKSKRGRKLQLTYL